MSGVPIRLRLTATFALAMAVVLAASGFLLYHHLATSLDRTLAQGLTARSADVAALVRQADAGLRDAHGAGDGTGFAQVLDVRGRIFDHSPGLAPEPLLTGGKLSRALQHTLLIRRARLSTDDVRLRATPIRAQGQRLVVVVGTPLETRDDALATLRTELLIGAPVALLLASLCGYLIAAAALRPVDRMRARATAISASRMSERLPVTRSRDEIARLGETLNAMLDRLEQALQRERSFVADASHELRTPLAHLRTEVELALERPRTHAELEAALQSVGAETDRLSQLAGDLLLLARLEDGGVPIRREAVDVEDLVQGVVARYARRASQVGRSVVVECSAGRVEVDRLRIEQALANLFENALRHGLGPILVEASRRDAWLTLRVVDRGPGFPAGFAEHAFERFSRADHSRGSAGVGLGLAIVAAVAHAHGGVASAQNVTPQGTAVSIKVPTARARGLRQSA